MKPSVRKIVFITMIVIMLLSALAPLAAFAAEGPVNADDVQLRTTSKAKRFPPKDQPDPEMYRLRRQIEKAILSGDQLTAQSMAVAEEGKALVLLLEFSGTDTITWEPGDQWDPYGVAEIVEAEDYGDCSNVITETTEFTFGPTLHNEVPKPPSAEAAYKGATADFGFTMWTPDFSKEYYEDMVFGEGLSYSYTAENGDPVEINIDESMRIYYETLSNGMYSVSGEIIGWIPLPHSMPWYGADPCPGNLSLSPISGAGSDGWYGHNPDAEDEIRVDYGTPQTAIMDAVDWINENIPDFDWAQYDGDGDGHVDTIITVNAGVGEANSGADEHAIWPHSSSVNYCADPGADGECDTDDDIRTGSYIMQGETTGISTFTHEFGHRLGADDLYAYGYGDTSAGVWSNMGDDRGHGAPWDSGSVGMDPWHMLGWGWIDPVVVDYGDPAMEITLGQTADLPDGTEDSILIKLPDIMEQIEEAHSPVNMWWGGRENLRNDLVYRPLDLSAAAAAELTFWHHYDIETEWDYGFVQISTDDGTTWTSLANKNTTDILDPSAIDYVVDNVPGFTDHNEGWTQETFDLSAYVGQQVLLGFRYATDWGSLENGWWVDDIMVTADGETVFSDDIESGAGDWMADPDGGWSISDGVFTYPHYYLVEWRNDAGIDHNLAVGRCDIQDWGMVVWYINDQKYTANEIYDYLEDSPSFGPKGKALIVDAHPEPQRDATSEYAQNARSNVSYRCYGVRDVAFGLSDLDPFYVTQPPTNPDRWGNPDYEYPALPAVPAFHDSMSYYPGLEYTNIRSVDDDRGPLVFWAAKERDASVVVPAQSPYGIGPVEYDRSGFLQWMTEEAAWYGWKDWPAGTGNPGDTAVQYGIHLEVTEQAEDGSWGKIRYWNSMIEIDGSISQTPSADPLTYGDTVDIEVNVSNAGSGINGVIKMPIDLDEAYVDGSAWGGAVPLTAAQAAELDAQYGIEAPVYAAAADDSVVAISWVGPMGSGDSINFGFSTEITARSGSIQHSAAIFDDAALVHGLYSDVLDIVDDGVRTVGLPLVADTYVNGGDEATNFDDHAILTTRTSGLDNILLTFDRSALPDDVTIIDGELRVYVETESGAIGKSLTVLNVDAFDSTTVTYDDAPATFNPGDAVALVALGELSFDVTAQIASWADSSQLAIASEGHLGRISIDSLESYQTVPATLTVTYQVQ